MDMKELALDQLRSTAEGVMERRASWMAGRIALEQCIVDAERFGASEDEIAAALDWRDDRLAGLAEAG